MRSGGVIGLMLVLLLSVACSEPSAHEEFLKAPRKSYDFVFREVDTLSLYDISFYTRYDAIKNRGEMLQLDITWTDPEDSCYRETVFMEKGDRNGVDARYRTGLRFPKQGDWTLSVDVNADDALFRGMGIKWNKQYGTR